MPERVGHYEIVEQIGEGGMGTVYRARDPRFDRRVAVKVLHRHLLRDTGLVERFKAEAIIQAKLDHPHVVTVLDFIGEPGSLAIVMEYVEGRSLAALLEDHGGPLDVRRAVRLVDQVLSAVGHAHAHGLIHRDLKPANVLVREVGGSEHVKVLDFGIAKILGTDKQKTATAATMGTLAYMSPEQVRSPKGVDARSDIYSIGVLLYELLSGRTPHAGESDYELMQAIVAGPPPDVNVLGPGVPSAVRGVVARALAKHPAMRFQTCEQMRAALASALAEAPAGSTLRAAGSGRAPFSSERLEWHSSGNPHLEEWQPAEDDRSAAGAPRPSPVESTRPVGTETPRFRVERSSTSAASTSAAAASQGSNAGALKWLALPAVMIIGVIWIAVASQSPSAPSQAEPRVDTNPGYSTPPPSAAPSYAPAPSPLRTKSEASRPAASSSLSDAAVRSRIDSDLRAGRSAYEDARYDEAIARFDSVLQADPGNRAAKDGKARARRAKQAEISTGVR